MKIYKTNLKKKAVPKPARVLEIRELREGKIVSRVESGSRNLGWTKHIFSSFFFYRFIDGIQFVWEDIRVREPNKDPVTFVTTRPECLFTDSEVKLYLDIFPLRGINFIPPTITQHVLLQYIHLTKETKQKRKSKKVSKEIHIKN